MCALLSLSMARRASRRRVRGYVPTFRRSCHALPQSVENVDVAATHCRSLPIMRGLLVECGVVGGCVDIF